VIDNLLDAAIDGEMKGQLVENKIKLLGYFETGNLNAEKYEKICRK
jgi:hypothetical protein